MDHSDHVSLLRAGVPAPGGVWADLGSGRGAFTLALADLIGPEGDIYSVDRDRGSLRVQEQRMEQRFPGVRLYPRAADFNQPLDLPPLDGIVMANSLHFQRDQLATARLAREYLKPGGRLLIVEYNIRRGNYAVPHPVPYEAWVGLAEQAGFEHTRLLARRPSSMMKEIYSACSLTEGVLLNP
jgi:ubiquinone/menaquinone biosynthesis C-methylase UbiE